MGRKEEVNARAKKTHGAVKYKSIQLVFCLV
jgi:hypothetical protein